MTDSERQRLYAKARQTAVGLLARREHSRKELAQKLATRYRSLDSSQIMALLDELAEDGYQSDTRCSESLVRSRVNRGYGPNYIRGELTLKGLQPDDLDRLVETMDIDWYTTAALSVGRRLSTAQESRAGWQKAARFLQRRGFSSDVVRETLGPIPPI